MAKKPTTPPTDTNDQPDAAQRKFPAVPIVAIGASAGGLEAITELLQHLPSTTGLAYVYIQHLDPTHESRLSEILGWATNMPVLEAENLMRVEPNHVYVIPPTHDLEVVDGVLTTVPRPRRSSLHMPVDQFFQSLADRQGDGAVAVVLSGMDGDGTQGLRAIKAAGGFTFAQDDTALFQSMPKSAIAEGVVDRVLPPAQIAQELDQLSRQPAIFQQTELAEEQENTATPTEDLKAIITHLRRTIGVDFNHYKITTVRRRIVRRMMLHRLETLRDYIAYLRKHADESMALYNDLLINVTTFFRDSETMDYLKKVLLPQLLREKQPRDPLRIWVPACSTGQEAYSIAMLVLEVLTERKTHTSIQIFATDLSEQAIAKARLGAYSKSEVADVSAKRLQQFFTKTDDTYRISKYIRDLCVFAPHNVFRDPPFSRLHLVSCRNLLIYLDNVLQRKAFSTFHYALNPGGYLLLGKSETVGGSSALFTQVEKNYKVYARKNDVTSRAVFELEPRTPLSSGLPDNRPLPLPAPPVERDQNGRRLLPAELAGRRQSGGRSVGGGDLDQVVDNLLLTQYVPASVVVNADLDILQFRGSTSLYLEPAPGKASLNLLKMARPSLTFELRNAVHKAVQAGQAIRKDGLEVKVGDKIHHIAIEAVPIPVGSDERLFLITFRETTPALSADASLSKARSRRVKELEDELESVRRDMHAIIEEQEASNEELQSANEEIISSNEELQSINEELETSKEEIESTNEELLTINQELQIRNEQLTEAYEFAETIFATLREATIVLDPMLRIKSANRTFYQLFGMREENTEGRLLYELDGRQWDNPALRELLEQVALHDTPITGFELPYRMPTSTTALPDERTLLLNARRVLRQGRQEAILLAIEDITERRRVRVLLEEREAWFHAIADSAPVSTWVAGADGRYTFFNNAWLDYTGRTLEDELVRGWALDIHSDDRDQYQTLYQQRLAAREPFSAEYRLRRRDGEYRWMLESARPIFNPDGKFTGYIGSSTEVHLQKMLNQELDRRVQERVEELAEVNENMRQESRRLIEAQALGHVGSFEWNVGDAVTHWSDELFRLNGLEPQSLVVPLELTDQLIHPLDLPAFKQLQAQAVQTPGRYELMHRIVWRDGTTRWVQQRFESVTDDTGQVVRVRGTLQDITEQRQAEAALRQTADNLQAVLNNSPASIGFAKAVFDKPDELVGDPAVDRIVDFRLLVANEKFARLVGQPLEELRGQSIERLGGLLWGDDTFLNIKRIVEVDQPVYEERQYEVKGQLRWYAISAVKYDAGVALTGLDITDLKQAAQEQDTLLRQLETSEHTLHDLELIRQQVRERGELLRQTSHDLRSSFGVIQGAAQLLDMASTDEERTQMLEMLQRNLRQVTQILTQLLDFSRLEAGQETVALAPFDAADLLRELGGSVQSLADERKLTIRVEGPDHLPVVGDAVKVRRIAQNLVLNALKYTRKGNMAVGWQADGDGWLLHVADTGPGLPPKVVRQLTDDPDADNHPMPDGPVGASDTGEGIGLFIVQRLVKLLGTKLMVDSVPDGGTRFEIRFDP